MDTPGGTGGIYQRRRSTAIVAEMTFSRASDKLIIIDHTDGAGRASRPAHRQPAARAGHRRRAREGRQDLSALPVRRGAVPPPPGIPGRALHDERAATDAARRAGADRHVVRTAQPLDRDDALVRQPPRLRGRRRAVLRGLSEDHRPRPSDARRDPSRITRPTGGRSTRRSPGRRPAASSSSTRST